MSLGLGFLAMTTMATVMVVLVADQVSREFFLPIRLRIFASEGRSMGFVCLEM